MGNSLSPKLFSILVNFDRLEIHKKFEINLLDCSLSVAIADFAPTDVEISQRIKKMKWDKCERIALFMEKTDYIKIVSGNFVGFSFQRRLGWSLTQGSMCEWFIKRDENEVKWETFNPL